MYKKIFSLLLIFSLLFIVGCSTIEDYPKDGVQIDESKTFEYNIVDTFRTGLSNSFKGVYIVDNYGYYEEVVKDRFKLEEYSKEYFETKGILIYGREEPSGSIRLEIDRVGLDNKGGLVVKLIRRVPKIMTDDMAYHVFIIEYVLPSKPLGDFQALVKTINVRR